MTTGRHGVDLTTTKHSNRKRANRVCAVRGCKNPSTWIPELICRPSFYTDLITMNRHPYRVWLPSACVCDHHRARIERDYGPEFFVNDISWAKIQRNAEAGGYHPPDKERLEVQFRPIKQAVES